MSLCARPPGAVVKLPATALQLALTPLARGESIGFVAPCTDVELVPPQPELPSWQPSVPLTGPLTPAGNVLALQRSAGNQSVVRALGRCAGTTDGSACGNKSPEDMATFAALRRTTEERAQVGERCACGGTILPGGECTKCKAQRLRSEGVATGVVERAVAEDELVARSLMRAPKAGTATAAPALDFRPSANGSPCACLVFMHNDERNARLTAELMHAHCSYNLAIVSPDNKKRDIQLPSTKGTTDPNELFPRDVAEQCLDDPKPCHDFLAANEKSTDPAVIKGFAQRQFFLTIRECSNAFKLPVIALHNNTVTDTAGFRKAKPNTAGVKGGTFRQAEETEDPGDTARPLKELRDWLKDNLDKGTTDKMTGKAGTTNIFRWCVSPDISRCHVGDPDHPDTVVWTTNEDDFERIAKEPVNVVLQSAAATTGESATDLSTLFLTVGELIKGQSAQVIADLERGVAVDVDRIRAVLRDLGKLREHGDMTAGDALAGGFEIIKTVIELLLQLLRLAIARGGLAMRLSQVRYINIETPSAPVRPGQTQQQLRDESFTSILTVLRAAGLECCSDDPGTGEAAVREGLAG
jgi:hypothetical protein